MNDELPVCVGKRKPPEGGYLDAVYGQKRIISIHSKLQEL
jgi:hypothetical protein